MNSDHRKYFDSQILPCYRRMYAAALAMLGSTDDAADAVQTAMLNIWEAVADGRRFDAPVSYALSALRNVCLSAIEKRRKNVGIDTVDAPEAPDAADALANLGDATRLLGHLPERERKALVLNAFAGCDASEISATLGVSPVNARQILSRARKKLRSLFE